MGVTSGEKAILWRVAAQIEIVGSKVVGRAARQVGGLCGLQRWLDNAGDARRHLVLKLEIIFERTVETVWPQMRASIL
jgi:hypothetical protein